MPVYYFLLSSISFFLFGLDKIRAIKSKGRISEKTLLLFTALGGAFGSFAGMIVFRHKIRKPEFFILVPFFSLVHIVIIIFLGGDI